MVPMVWELRSPNSSSPGCRWLETSLLMVVLGFATFIRWDGLGARSLWADEFCTWHVSQMPLDESLRWGPELTKPPLYQVSIRAISDTPRPDEQTLRWPAAASGALTVLVVWWLGSMAGGWTVGFAGALLIACQALQIDYSQETRSYTMLAAGSALSVGLWCQLLTHRGRAPWRIATAYVVATVLTFHAHYLMLLTVAGQVVWWVLTRWTLWRINDAKRSRLPAGPIALAAAGLLCMPMVWHYLRHRASIFQGLDWIAPPTVADAASVLEKLTFGPIWVYGILGPALALWVVAIAQRSRGSHAPMELEKPMTDVLNSALPTKEPRSLTLDASRKGQALTALFASVTRRINDTKGEHGDPVGLLLAWLAMSWLGLLVISWIAHPAMVDRYALPAAVPAVLIPLVVAHRLDRRAPVVIALAFFVATAGQWTSRSQRVMPGFREMVELLNEVVDPQREVVVVAIDRNTSPGWEEMDLLGFDYYPLRRGEVFPLYLRGDRLDGDQPILDDPRGLYIVTFLADPERAIESAGRTMGRVRIDDRTFTQLLFTPYRLFYVMPES